MFKEKTLREAPGWKTTLIVFCAFALGACGGLAGRRHQRLQARVLLRCPILVDRGVASTT